MVKSAVPKHLFSDYSYDFSKWLLNDYDICKNQKSNINEEIKNKKYDSENINKILKIFITNNKNRFIEESNSYSYYKIKYGFIKKIDKKIIELVIDYLKNYFENHYLN
jgi:hypothetical protein